MDIKTHYLKQQLFPSKEIMMDMAMQANSHAAITVLFRNVLIALSETLVTTMNNL